MTPCRLRNAGTTTNKVTQLRLGRLSSADFILTTIARPFGKRLLKRLMAFNTNAFCNLPTSGSRS
jgi:hypothetical protein